MRKYCWVFLVDFGSWRFGRLVQGYFVRSVVGGRVRGVLSVSGAHARCRPGLQLGFWPFRMWSGGICRPKNISMLWMTMTHIFIYVACFKCEDSTNAKFLHGFVESGNQIRFIFRGAIRRQGPKRFFRREVIFHRVLAEEHIRSRD